MKRLLLHIGYLLLLSGATHGQTLTANDIYWEYLRTLELQSDSAYIRLNQFNSHVFQHRFGSVQGDRWGVLREEPTEAVVLHDVNLLTFFNSGFAKTYKDGPVWAGKGITAAISGGIHGHIANRINYSLNPTIWSAQNTDFQTATNNFRYPWLVKIDYVQRYGTDPVHSFNPGNSFIELDLNGHGIGVSTQNFIWGPAERYSILMNNNGPGAPHAYIGSIRPLKVKALGILEYRVIWGVMNESDYFDTDPTNDDRFLNGLSFAIRPKWIPNLILGLNRIFYKRGEEFEIKDIPISLVRWSRPNVPAGAQNDEYDQMFSLTARWMFPKEGFEAYIEYAKNDYSGSLFNGQPEHGSAYVVGFNKLFELPESTLKFNLETSSLDIVKLSSQQRRPSPPYYSHTYVLQGYTHEGQLLGSYIGPNSNATAASLTLFKEKVAHGVSVETIRYDNEYYIRNFPDNDQPDYEWSLGYKVFYNAPKYLFGLNSLLTFRRNLYYQKGNHLTNLHLEFSCKIKM